ncbi:N-6 DNA methylase [Microcystis aeruginosa BLCCF158]|uniref:N-6 DNA methylase n=1 Tax=Microcystis aeruginosa BLCC-F158 TaxID=2755316 RepID=A0A841UXM6_MICAE|nr:N-6 DNA methylase [Microcystis aeruginosa]MBC1195262.1 N-6 DNA methylase [Microcystis aeruginosa BLCC-F158]
MHNLNLDQKVRGKRMLETKALKDIELAFRQFGYEGEDVFNVIAYSYIDVFAIETTKKLDKIIMKGHCLSEIVFQDKTLQEVIYCQIKKDVNGKNLPIFYQYFLAKRFRDITGKFFTPHAIAEQMVSMLPIKSDALIMDPTCGSGTFLKEAGERWQYTPCHLIANDVDEMLVCLTELVLRINTNQSQNISLFTSNIYRPDQEIQTLFGQVDYIVANPPFSLSINLLESQSDLFNLGYRNSDALFIDLALELLKPDGRLVCLLPHSIISNKEYEKLRQSVEKSWLLTAVIILPEGVFQSTSNTTTRADIIVLDKKGKNTINKKTIFSNISSIGIPLNNQQKKTESNDLKTLLENKEVAKVLGI